MLSLSNLRFPGQYFDSETNANYSYFRDYDPQTGRYRQSDPMGLHGGMNTYIYVRGNPLRNMDPFGLQALPLGGGPAGGFGGLGAFGLSRPGGSSPNSNSTGSRELDDALGGGRADSSAHSEEGATCDTDKEGECEKRLDREERGLCPAIAIQWGRQGVAVCLASARTRYSECLRFGPNGVRTPLAGVDTPL